jgi:SNF2 family DNA or RNA helicase
MTAPAVAHPETIRATLERAVLTLAGQCDGAAERDGVGFNRYDVGYGHHVARSIQNGEDINLATALKVVSKYRKQLERAGIMLPDADAVAVALELRRADRVVAREAISATPKVSITRGASDVLTIRFAYDSALVAKVKALPGRKFDGAGKWWTVPFSSVFQALEAFPDAEVSESLRELVSAKRAEVAAADVIRKELVAAAIARYEAIVPALSRKPFAHQDDGIRWLIENRFCILADDMGLGKTFQALVAARALGHRIMIVCPAGLRDNWLREARIVDARVEVYSWAKVPEPLTTIDYTLIVDEAHYGQNMKAARTKAFLELAKHAAAVFELTGTPIKNGRPVNLFPLLVGARHPLGADRRSYEKRYCNAGPTRWSRWDTTGCSYLEELHAKVSDSILRRMKEDCLDLPAKSRVMRGVELSSEAADLYEETLSAMQAEYRARKMRGEIGEADALVLMNHLRHAGSVAKVEEAAEIAEEVLEQGGQIVFFFAFLDSAKQLANILGGAGVGLITGEQDSTERQTSIDAFQRGALRVMVCTLGAGNVGITLTAAQTVVLVDRPWTPGDAIQAEDRLYRIGQRSAVTALWLQATDMDRGLDRRLDQKQQWIETVLNGEAKSIEFEPISIRELAEEVLGS